MLGKLKALGAGFVLGLLLAPRSGRQSRQMIRDWFDDFLEGGSRRETELEDEPERRREPLAETDWSVPETGETLP